MSTRASTINEDYKFFDFLAPYRWPDATRYQLSLYRELVDNGDLQIETVLENALCKTSKGLYKRISENFKDFSDNSDAKKATSSYRNNKLGIQWTNSVFVSGISKKTGLIRALVYSRANEQFYFFAIPHQAYKNLDRVEISMDVTYSADAPIIGVPKGKWTKCMVPTFERLATITHQEALAQWNKIV